MSHQSSNADTGTIDLGVRSSGSSALFSRPQGEWWRGYRAAVIAVDIVVVSLALLIANIARFSGGQTSVVGLQTLTYPIISMLLGAGWIMLLLASIHRLRLGPAADIPDRH